MGLKPAARFRTPARMSLSSSCRLSLTTWRRAFEAGAAGYLLKSEIPRYLFGTIATALRQRSLSGRSYPGTGLEDMAAREG